MNGTVRTPTELRYGFVEAYVNMIRGGVLLEAATDDRDWIQGTRLVNKARSDLTIAWESLAELSKAVATPNDPDLAPWRLDN
jgi:hypothetical protein